SANNRAPSATLAALIGLSAGTAGTGNPRGKFQVKSGHAYSDPADAAAAAPSSAAASSTGQRALIEDSPAGAGAFAGETGGLRGDGAALAHPGGEGLERGGIDASGIATM